MGVSWSAVVLVPPHPVPSLGAALGKTHLRKGVCSPVSDEPLQLWWGSWCFLWLWGLGPTGPWSPPGPCRSLGHLEWYHCPGEVGGGRSRRPLCPEEPCGSGQALRRVPVCPQAGELRAGCQRKCHGGSWTGGAGPGGEGHGLGCPLGRGRGWGRVVGCLWAQSRTHQIAGP